MSRRIAAGVALLACLLLCAGTASAASGWKRFATGLINSTEPASLRTASGHELIVWNSSNALYLLRDGTLETLLSGEGLVNKPALVQQPDGTLQLYVPMQNADASIDGVARLSSSDDGATWSAPVQTNSHDIADVGSAAVGPDGTPYFTQSGTGYVDVYIGLNGDSMQNVFTGDCCGYAESVAVDSLGVVRVAFWSNATSEPNKFVLETLGGGMQTYGTQSIPRSDRVPLVSYGSNTYLEWSNGYPSSKVVALERFPRGHNVVLGRGKFVGGDPHMALALEPDGKLWALWTENGFVLARRSRTSGVTFGAVVAARIPQGPGYQLEAFARPGSVEALLNTGSSLWETKLLPGISVSTFRGTAIVTDDGVRLKGATLRGGGRTLHTNAAGKVSLGKLKPGTLVSVMMPGYTPTSFRVR